MEDVFGASFCVQKNTRLSLWAVRERERVKSVRSWESDLGRSEKGSDFIIRLAGIGSILQPGLV